MQSEDDSLIREMVDTIVREANPDTVILFGSRARGDARPDSDVDLLIVEPEPFSPQRSRRQETARLYLALRKLAIAKDLLLYSRDEFERLKDPRTISSAAPSAKERFCMRASDHGQDLLLMARKDFDALRGMLDNPLFADEIFGFHAQQAIEKSLKAWLAAWSLSFPLTQVRVECLGRGPAAAWRKKG